ncbi:MAG: fructosamine kinase family protein [Acidimicrobiales bacterium]
MTSDSFADQLAHVLDVELAAMAPVSGGDVADSYQIELADGRVLFAKRHLDAPPGFFTTEAVGLEWLRSTGTVAVPEVVAVSDDPALLVLEWIPHGSATSTTDPDLGRALAELHSSGAPCFGREDRRTTGSRRLPNPPCTTWVEFYADCRLLPLARLAADARALAASTVRSLESVAGRLDQLGGPVEPPAPLHGDLWAGNRLVGAGGVSWLIDPAAHGGHREFDLAMMALFGGFGPECLDAYQEVTPLADGWRDRVPLHQLAPLVVHAIKFGGGYAAATERALATLV